MPALLDPQYEKFAQSLAALEPPIKAYASAGYVPHRGNARRLAQKSEVQQRVMELTEQAAELANITAARVLVEIDRVGRANLGDFIEPDVDMNGKPNGKWKFKDLTKLPRALMAAIQSIDYDSNGKPSIKLHDRNQANFTLLKHLGGLPDENLRPNQIINIFDGLSPEDKRALADALEALPGGQGGGHKAIEDQRQPAGSPA